MVQEVATVLRQSGIRTMAKITGDEPVLIDPNGERHLISRRGPARIQEQLRIVKTAADLKVEALIVECMAIDPHLQFISENKIIRSTIGVITNARRDHLEVLGNNPDHIAACLSQTIPRNGVFITADPNQRSYFASRAAANHSQIYFANVADIKPPMGEDTYFASYEADSISGIIGTILNLKQLGKTGSGLAENGQKIKTIEFCGRKIQFVDAFSVNDVDSLKIIQQAIFSREDLIKPVIALLNNRVDRPLRMTSFTSFLAQEDGYDQIMLTGDHRHLAQFYLRRYGRRKGVYIIKAQHPEEIIKEISKKISLVSYTVIGMGNYKGIGQQMIYFFKERETR